MYFYLCLNKIIKLVKFSTFVGNVVSASHGFHYKSQGDTIQHALSAYKIGDTPARFDVQMFISKKMSSGAERRWECEAVGRAGETMQSRGPTWSEIMAREATEWFCYSS